MAEDRSMATSREKSASEVQVQKAWPFRPAGDERETHVSFPVDICETDEAFILVGEMPGVRKDAVNIRLAENQLAITGRFGSPLKENERVGIREVPGASFQRAFTLSDAVDQDEISAELKDGLLTVKLAKSERTKPRQIQIS